MVEHKQLMRMLTQVASFIDSLIYGLSLY